MPLCPWTSLCSQVMKASGFPPFTPPQLEDTNIQLYFEPVIVLTAMAFMESISIGQKFARERGVPHAPLLCMPQRVLLLPTYHPTPDRLPPSDNGW